MKKAFIIYGTIICLMFTYMTFTGLSVHDMLSSGKWGPAGKNAYHK